MLPLEREGDGESEDSSGKPEMARTWKHEAFLQAIAQKTLKRFSS